MKILVTGATGFIGSHCVETLRGMDCEIHAVSHGNGQPPGDSGNLVWHRANLLEMQDIRKLMNDVKPSHLLHLSWYVAPGSSQNAIVNFYWTQASLELLLRFGEYGGKRVVMAGSSFEYDWNYGYCTESITPKNPSTFYGTCKNALQEMLAGYSEVAKISSAWARIFFLFGPNEHPHRLVPSVIKSLLDGNPALCSHGNQIRDYLYVKDVAGALVKIIESDIIGPVNIGSGDPIRLKDLIKDIGNKIGRDELIRLGAIESRPNDTHIVVANIDRLKNELNWVPRYSLSQGLDETIEWFKKRNTG